MKRVIWLVYWRKVHCAGREVYGLLERYTRPEMGSIWTLENRYRKFLDIEIAVCFALADKGIIPRDAAEAIARKAVFSVERIAEIELLTRHDVVAFTRCVAESLGEESRYFHYGLTSYDVVDTALEISSSLL